MIDAANRFQLSFQKFASLRPVAFLFRHAAHHLDRVAVKLFRGHTLSGTLAGIPNIMLTTTGARSGQERTVPLIGLDVNGAVAVVGTRFGSDENPGWYYNLTKDPHAVIEVNGVRTRVVARSVPDGEEYDRLMTLADSVYAGYAKYRTRIQGRRIPIFVLEPE